MAKVIWWLTVIITALTNNVAPFHMEEIPFVQDKYYTSAYGDDVDPKSLYQTFFSAIDDGLVPCHPEATSVPNLFGTTQAGDNAGDWAMKTYFLPTGGDSASIGGSYNIPEDKVIPIVAPMACKILTAPDNSNNSTSMVVETTLTGDLHYTIELHKLDHWYCCHGNPKYKGHYKHYGVTSESYPQINRGQVLGYANSETYIIIYNDKHEPISFDTFFGTTNKYTTKLDATNWQPTN